MATAASAEEFVPLSDTEQTSVLTRLCEFPRLVLEAAPGAAIFRINALPTAMPILLGRLNQVATRKHLDFATLAHASGIVYAAFFATEGNEISCAVIADTVEQVFQACALPEIDARAMLEWCPSELKRAAGSVWGPWRQEFALMQRVKKVFDPHDILSPGRFAGEIRTHD
jgi:hypothetical protein